MLVDFRSSHLAATMTSVHDSQPEACITRRTGDGAVAKKSTWLMLLLVAASALTVSVAGVYYTVHYIQRRVIESSPVQVGPFVFAPDPVFGNKTIVTLPSPGEDPGSGMVVVPRNPLDPCHISGIALIDRDRAVCKVVDETSGLPSYYVLDLVRGFVNCYENDDLLVEQIGPCPAFEPIAEFLDRVREVGLPPKH